MIIMDIVLDNFMAFNDFHMNLSYPKKIVRSYLKSECLKEHPNFRYKKLVIILGANASGKTSLGLMLNKIMNFITHANPAYLTEAVRDKNKNAELTFDFVLREDAPKLYRVGVRVIPDETQIERQTIEIYCNDVPIKKKDSYETAKSRLDALKAEYSKEYFAILNKKLKNPSLGFFFSYPADIGQTPIIEDSPIHSHVLENILRVLDPYIQGVEKVSEVKNAYSIKMLDGTTILIQDGKVINTKLLSSGTKAGIAIADMLASILEHKYGFYYCDEKFSYIQSDVECALLGIMANALGDYEQLFFTTHNTDVLSLPYPKHSYSFLKKTISDKQARIDVINADYYLKKNTDSLRNAVENDLFSIAPDIDMLFQLSAQNKNENER